MPTAAPRLLALVALAAAACGDVDDPTAGAEAIRGRCLAAAPPALTTTITGGSWRSEPCAGDPCERRLTVESTCVTYQAIAEGGEILQLSHGELTDEGRARGAAIAGALLGAALPGLAGACAGEPCEVRQITLVREGEGSGHELRGDATPAALADAAAYLGALRAALAACEGDDLIEIAGRCERE